MLQFCSSYTQTAIILSPLEPSVLAAENKFKLFLPSTEVWPDMQMRRCSSCITRQSTECLHCWVFFMIITMNN